MKRKTGYCGKEAAYTSDFFLSFVFGEHQREILDILSQETERDLLFYLIQHPGASQKELSNYARISPGTVNWHMKRLISSDLIEVHRDAQLVKYTVKGESSEILNLIRSYHPTLWQSWVDRIADAISDVTQTENEDAKTQSVDLEKSVDEDGF
ncbi:MAG: winged helix-turn-helix transcriptional regulator [Nitrososphaerales archaeon]